MGRTPPGRGSPGPGWGQACVLGTRQQGEPLCVSRVSAPLQKTGCCRRGRGGRWPYACLARRGARAPADRRLSGVRFLPRYLKPGSWLLAPGGRAGAAAACVTRMRNRDPDWGRAPMATAVVALETNLQAARPQGPPQAGPQLPAEALDWEGGDQTLSPQRTGRLTLQGHSPRPQPPPRGHTRGMWPPHASLDTPRQALLPLRVSGGGSRGLDNDNKIGY